MEVFVKSFADYHAVKKATLLSSSIVLDALDAESSTVTVRGTEINRNDVGSWLIVDGAVFQIQNAKPDAGKTVLTLRSPLDAFDRPLELEVQPVDQLIGAFIFQQLQRHWIACDDPVYAVPYLVVSNSDTTAYAQPELDASGCFALSEYCRLMRKTYRTAVRFTDANGTLLCSIENPANAPRQVSFEDGRSQLESVAYSVSGFSKITALHDIDTGEKDASGNAVYIRDRTNWYLSETGEISQLIPARRAAGEWGTVYVKGNEDVAAKVAEAFAKNKSSHKLEFWSTIDLEVQTDCTFVVYGELLKSYVSYKRKSSSDSRFYYKSGELKTTALEKLRGVSK